MMMLGDRTLIGKTNGVAAPSVNATILIYVEKVLFLGIFTIHYREYLILSA
jgi:hypothetical protein